MDLFVYGPLRSATGGKMVDLPPDTTADVETVADVLDALRTAYPRTESQLLDEDGELRPSVRVTVDGETAALDDLLPAAAEVRVFPAMRGG